MKIVIDYESSWRNSFLDGNNNEPLPKKGRNYVASMTELKKEGNYLPRQITINTVMGVLNRLIGDQRKLYQTRSELGDVPNYFADIENVIDFEDNWKVINSEIIYLRNFKGSEDQNSFTGMIRVNDPIFQSDYSPQFWGVLWLDIDALFEFVLENKRIHSIDLDLEPLEIMARLKDLKQLKPIAREGKAAKTAQTIQDIFEEFKLGNEKISVIGLYCSALYLQLQRLESHFDMASAKSKSGGISGISKNGFTEKDFMDRYTTGNKKIIFGNPYVRVEKIKGKGIIEYVLEKASGQLTIWLNLDFDRALELKKMIDNAGVSAFYLGKKGIAYVSQIEVVS